MVPGESSCPGVQNMFGKGGYRGFKAKVQAPKVDPQNTKTENAVLKRT